MKTKNFSVTPAGSWAWDGPWNVLYYDAGTDAGGQVARIRVQSADGSSVDAELKPGRQLKLATPAAGVIVTSLTGNGITGKVSVGSGDIQDSAVTGDVAVIDSARNIVLGDQSFLTGVYQPPVAGQYPHCILWNPTVSMKNLSVHLASLISGFNCQVTLRLLNATIAPALGGFAGWSGGGVPTSRNIGSAVAAQHQFYRGTAAALQGLQTALAGGTSLAANVARDVPRTRSPFVVKPGNGLIVVTDTLASDLSVVFDVEEFAP